MIQPCFNKYPDKLMPVVIQDASTRMVLMHGYMNEAAFQKTERLGRVVFFSRSRNELWLKGETSGNYLVVEQILLDCDQDCLLIKVTPAGPVCHRGTDTCFHESNKGPFLNELEAIIRERVLERKEGSYIASLFNNGINKIAQKVGEEAVELVIEAKDNDELLFKNEAADLLFHYLILLHAKGTNLSEIEHLLSTRR